MKRARERDDEAQIRSFENNNKKAKKRDKNLMKEKQKDSEAEDVSSSWDSSQLALGVFDFPWLKDGVISKTEDYFLDFEDKFSSSLEHEGLDFSEAYSFCETPEASKMVDTVWYPFEREGLEIKAEDVDCIWSSLLNKPLSQHGGSL